MGGDTMRRRTEREAEALRRGVLAERTLAAEKELASEGLPDLVTLFVESRGRHVHGRIASVAKLLLKKQLKR
jgi:hypothetical protein